ncbi:rpsK [Symbiodinium sp. CCMP2592]|nr:rpsK [Symbiodinium sp. CCMP2592]
MSQAVALPRGVRRPSSFRTARVLSEVGHYRGCRCATPSWLPAYKALPESSASTKTAISVRPGRAPFQELSWSHTRGQDAKVASVAWGLLSACLPFEAFWGVTGAAAAVLASLARSRRTCLAATQMKQSKVSRLKGGAMLTVRKSKNNAHVALCDKKGEIVWCTTEKRYGPLLPNANRAIEAALFVADKLGVESIVLQVKGSPGALGGIIATIRSSGINVTQAYVRNTIQYGGCRPRLMRRV